MTKNHKQNPSDHGFMRLPVVQDIAVFLVVVVSFWAAAQSQNASDEVRDIQDRQSQIVTCTRSYLTKTLDALNERTTYALAQANTNVELQKAQSAYLRIFFTRPPPNQPMAVQSLKEYFVALTQFVKISQKTQEKIKNNPLPTNRELNRCLRR